MAYREYYHQDGLSSNAGKVDLEVPSYVLIYSYHICRSTGGDRVRMSSYHLKSEQNDMSGGKKSSLFISYRASL